MSNASDFVIENGVLKNYTGPGGDVVVPEGVTSIGGWAFVDRCKSLTSLTLPQSLTSIDSWGFSICTSLTSIIVFEENQTYTSKDGIIYSKDMKQLLLCPQGKTGSISLPQGLTSIGKRAFYGCTSLTSITLPYGVKTIEEKAFAGCASITEILIPESVVEIYEGAFSNCRSLIKITIPDSVTYLGPEAFKGCSCLTKVKLSNSLLHVEESLFDGCSSLVDIRFPDRYYYFGMNQLPSKLLLQTLAGFAELFMQGNSCGFKESVMCEFETTIKKKRKAIYPYAVQNIYLLSYMLEKKMIPKNHMDECLMLAEEKGTAEIKAALIDYKKREFGDEDPLSGAMKLSTRLPKPVDKSSPKYLKKVWPCRNMYNQYSGSTQDCFISSYRGDDTDVVFPSEVDGVKIIGVSYRTGKAPAVYSSITSVHLPDGYRFFGNSAFAGCIKLREVFLPLSTEHVCSQVFMGCTALETVVLPYSAPTGKWMFRDCTALKDVYILSSWLSISGNAVFRGCKNYTVHAPVDAQIKEELRGKHFVPLTEADAEMLAKHYFSKPIRRHVYVNRSNMGTRKTIRTGESVTVVHSPDETGICRENGLVYEIDRGTYPELFAEYITGTIVSEVYKDENDRNCFDVELTLKSEYAG